MEKTKGLRGLDVFLGMICVLFFLDTCAPMAAMGVTAISWALIITVIFYIPSGFIMSELGSTFPDDGGVYSWVKRAFGSHWGARVSWMYWLNDAVWIASVSSVFVGLLSALFFPNIAFGVQIVIMLVVVWVMVALCFLPVDNAKWITNVAAVVKLMIAAGLIGSAIYYLFATGKPANDFSWAALKPEWGQSITYLPALIYNFLGMEAMLTLATHMKNPQKDIPKAVIGNSFLVAGLYIMVTAALLILIPTGKLSIVSGVIDGFMVAFGSSAIGRGVIVVLGCLFLATILIQTASWLLAACRMAAAAGDNHELPKIFAKRAKNHDGPIGAILLIGIIGTVLILIYGAMASTAEDLFWTLFSFVSIIYLMPFVINFQGFIKLRKMEKDIVRPFRFPGPSWLGCGFAHFGQFILLATIFLFFWVPGTTPDWFGWIIPLGVGVVVTLGVGEYLTYSSIKKQDSK
ncbi:MAG: APC family permease [Clostridiales bacterium]